jgi:hypothetical protein
MDKVHTVRVNGFWGEKKEMRGKGVENKRRGKKKIKKRQKRKNRKG